MYCRCQSSLADGMCGYCANKFRRYRQRWQHVYWSRRRVKVS